MTQRMSLVLLTCSVSCWSFRRGSAPDRRGLNLACGSLLPARSARLWISFSLLSSLGALDDNSTFSFESLLNPFLYSCLAGLPAGGSDDVAHILLRDGVLCPDVPRTSLVNFIMNPLVGRSQLTLAAHSLF